MSHQAPTPKFVTTYTRMPSKRPQLSRAGQLAEIRNYAKQRGLVIVAAYSDRAKGGTKP